MNPEESIEVVRSEDGGNGIPTETPSKPVEPVTPPVEDKPAIVEPETFELPDGRKVDAETLSREWKENFYPEYTRKSQELAAKTQPKEEPKSPTADPEWVPQSYEELLRMGEERALKAVEAREQARIDQQQAIEKGVIEQLDAVKKTDPTINENELFLHATKYGFKDLGIAHQNMKDMRDLAKSVQQTTAKNIAKRNDPVSISPGATGARPNPSNFATAAEYLRSLQQ